MKADIMLVISSIGFVSFLFVFVCLVVDLGKAADKFLGRVNNPQPTIVNQTLNQMYEAPYGATRNAEQRLKRGG